MAANNNTEDSISAWRKCSEADMALPVFWSVSEVCGCDLNEQREAPPLLRWPMNMAVVLLHIRY